MANREWRFLHLGRRDDDENGRGGGKGGEKRSEKWNFTKSNTNGADEHQLLTSLLLSDL